MLVDPSAVVPWFSKSPLDPRFAGSQRKNPEYDFLRKGSKAVGPVVVDFQHVKDPQAEIRASEQNFVVLFTLNVQSAAVDLRR